MKKKQKPKLPKKDLEVRLPQDKKKKLFYVIVCGGRYFRDYDFLEQKLDKQLKGLREKGRVIILQGYAGFIDNETGEIVGADRMAHMYARTRNIMSVSMPAQWNTHGKKAGFLRNSRLADYATHCIVFPGKTGTEMMLKIAKKRGLKIKDFSREWKGKYPDKDMKKAKNRKTLF